jgi:nucleotide-binding universal stress UspA family protein
MKRVRRVLYATDFSPASRRAFATAVDLARSFNAALTIVHVMTRLIPIVPEQYFDAELFDRIERQTREWTTRRLKSLADRAGRSGARVKAELREGDAAPEIIKAAKSARSDVIVVGTHGRTGIPKFFLGSVAERVVRTAACPVLTVRGK